MARELAALDPEMPAWRVLYEVLSRMEMTGAVRASLVHYNTREEVREFASALDEIGRSC